MSQDYDTFDEDQAPDEEDGPAIDFDIDPVDIRDEDDDDSSPDDGSTDDQTAKIENADLDNVLDELVDVVNGRDLDGMGELLASDAEANFLGETSRDGVIAGFNDLFLRYPTLLATRGDLGREPIVVMWMFDSTADRFDPVGYILCELTEHDDLVQRIEYVDELPSSDDLVVETPESGDLSEWDDWSALDED